ncbi:MAG: transaldolase family protein [Candidatus Nanohaloarchaea archaeon]
MGDLKKIFIDTSELDEIKRVQDMGVIDGCTTNPKILASEDVTDFEDHMRKVLELVDGPVSIEVTSNEVAEMVDQALTFDSWGENAVVKLPMTENGLTATRIVSEEGVDVNVTACMSPDQVLMAGKAGARFASIFMGRVGDMGFDAERVISNAAELIEGEETEILVGSIRKAYDVQRAFLAGADAVTIPPEYFEQLIHNPRSESSINEFLEHWNGS